MAARTTEHVPYVDYVAARWGALLRTAYLLTGDPASGEDLLQDTLLKAYVKWQHITRADSIDAYLRRMLVNEFVSTQRRQQRRAARAHLLPVPAPVADDAVHRLGLWELLATLAPRQRAVLVLRYYEDLTETEIAELLGCSRGTVKSQAHDALRRLREHLGSDEEAIR